MTDPTPNPDPARAAADLQSQAATTRPTAAALFTPPSARSQPLSWGVWVLAGALVLALGLGLTLAGRHKASSLTANAVLPLDPGASKLPITDTVMSESTSLSGGKSTFIDGHLHNTGDRTVTGATVQVFFRNDEGMPPHIETLPISLIRTREPYVDLEPISAAPIAPGEDREFRLIFESVPGNWNVQAPEIHVVHITTR